MGGKGVSTYMEGQIAGAGPANLKLYKWLSYEKL